MFSIALGCIVVVLIEQAKIVSLGLLRTVETIFWKCLQINRFFCSASLAFRDISLKLQKKKYLKKICFFACAFLILGWILSNCFRQFIYSILVCCLVNENSLLLLRTCVALFSISSSIFLLRPYNVTMNWILLSVRPFMHIWLNCLHYIF